MSIVFRITIEVHCLKQGFVAAKDSNRTPLKSGLIQKNYLMERRLGGALILIENKESVNKLNQILTTHSNVIIGRQGIPLLDRSVSIISLVLQGTTDEISALTGPIGKLDGVQVKSVMMKGNPL